MSYVFNFIGLVAFFCPCLVLHMHRVKANRNCLLPFLKHPAHSASSTSFSGKTTTTVTTSASPDLILTNNNNKSGEVRSQSTATAYKIALTNYLNKSSRHHHKSSHSSGLLKSRVLRYGFLILFLGYNVFNWLVIIYMGRANLPVLDALPKGSYLRKHLELHYEHFALGKSL